MRLIQCALCGLLLMISNFVLAESPTKKTVMGWIPAYGIEQSRLVLNANPHILNGLTRVGLQFWNPTADGKGVVFAPTLASGQILQQADVRALIHLLKAHKIEVLLTVYNNSQVSNRWDWVLARRAFREHPWEFSAALMAQVRDFGVDGIDLDLEGEGDFEVDRVAYADFVKTLSNQLKKQKKLLTIDSFHSPCANAPNMSWWHDWLGYVDAIHSMGYQDLYEGSTQQFTPIGRAACEHGAHIFKYSWQLAYGRKAGYRSHQILMGMPTWMANWGEGGIGSSISAHLLEVQKIGASIALWDLQLTEPAWRSQEIWSEIQRFRR